MQIESIELINFRCYERATLKPCAGITALCGDNAQGKTALLEAVYLCCTGRSHRTPRERELIRWQERQARVTVKALRRDGSHEVRIDLFQDQRRTVTVGGTRIGRSGEMLRASRFLLRFEAEKKSDEPPAAVAEYRRRRRKRLN